MTPSQRYPLSRRLHGARSADRTISTPFCSLTPPALRCRLSDGAMYVGHPLMLRPYIEHHTNSTFDSSSANLSHDVLAAAEELSLYEFKAAEAHLTSTDVRPAPVHDILAACALATPWQEVPWHASSSARCRPTCICLAHGPVHECGARVHAAMHSLQAAELCACIRHSFAAQPRRKCCCHRRRHPEVACSASPAHAWSPPTFSSRLLTLATPRNKQVRSRFAAAVPAPPGPAPRTPRLFLELKNHAYTTADAADIWDQVQRLHVEPNVALWAMDAPHYSILKAATGGAVQVIWGYMDQNFSDVVSSVPHPAPVPPPVQVRDRSSRLRHVRISRGLRWPFCVQGLPRLPSVVLNELSRITGCAYGLCLTFHSMPTRTQAARPMQS
jgi:hypothetical protein